MFRALRTISTARRHFTTVSVGREGVSIPALRTSFPFHWLRDSCQCPNCVHPSTRQRLIRSSDVARNAIGPVKAETIDGGLRVLWANPHAETPHVSFYSAEFLSRHTSTSALTSFHHDVLPKPWVGSQVAAHPPIPYAELENPEILLGAYERIIRDGLVFFSGVPTAETSNEKCELRALAQKLGEIRKTFYGETWDVRNVRNSKNIAYTNLDLGFHIDLPYFQDPPRYQILHSLRNRVRNGQSLFVDGLHAAYRLRDECRNAFDLLSSIPIPFHYINDGHHLHSAFPTIELESNAFNFGESPRIKNINYSPHNQAPFPLSTPPELYNAFAEFADRLNDPDAFLTQLLKEGDAVLFDNRRVLHARAAFEEIEEIKEGETNRWLKGCYLEEDPVVDRMRVLSANLEK